MSRAPWAVFSPEQMAQLARAGFRPPAPMTAALPSPSPSSSPPSPLPAAEATPGFNLGDLMPLAELGLGAWKPAFGERDGDPATAHGRTADDADLGGYRGDVTYDAAGNRLIFDAATAAWRPLGR